MKVTVKGIPRAQTQLKKTLDLSEALRAELTARAAARVHAEVYRLTPVDTGALRASGQVTVAGDVITYRNPQPYTPFVEHGTGIRGEASWQDIFRSSSFADYLPETPKPAFSPTWPGMVGQPFARPAIVFGISALINDLRELISKAVYELYYSVTAKRK
jgi:hypothetical protein